MAEELVPVDLRNELFAVFRSSLGASEPQARFRNETAAAAARWRGSWVKAAFLEDRQPRYLEALRQCPTTAQEPGLQRDVEIARILFNLGLFFDCHEYLEPLWQRAAGREKRVLQGLIQAGAGMHKLEQGGTPGCARLLQEAAVKLADAQGAGLRAFGQALAAAAVRAARGELTPLLAPQLAPGGLEL